MHHESIGLAASTAPATTTVREATSSSSSTAAAAWTAVFASTSFIDEQWSSFVRLIVDRFDGGFGVGGLDHFHGPEAVDGQRFLAIVPEVIGNESPLNVIVRWGPDA